MDTARSTRTPTTQHVEAALHRPTLRNPIRLDGIGTAMHSLAGAHGADLAAELAGRHPMIFGSAGWAEMPRDACDELLDRFAECGGSVIDKPGYTPMAVRNR
jgi:hypothetical protein